MKVRDLIYRHEAIRTITSYNGTVDKSVAKRLLLQMPSAEPEPKCNSCRYRNLEWYEEPCDSCTGGGESCHYKPKPERLTDDDFETIRIHLNALKERLCNQRRWKEAEDYERLINRFISFASAQPEHLVKESGDLVKDLVNDCINRQDAIDAVRYSGVQIRAFKMPSEEEMFLVDKAEVQTVLMMLPSAESEIIRCKDCKYWTHIKRTNRYWCKTDDGLFDLSPSPDDFCSRAERRTE